MSRLAALLAVQIATTSSAWACATCEAGDPSIAIVGAERPTRGAIRVYTEASYRYVHRIDGGATWFDNRVSLVPSVAWTVHPRVVLTVALPLAMASERAPNLGWQRGLGLGDATLSARIVALRAEGRSANLGGLSVGMELPTALRVRHDGAPAAEHTQLGDGAWTPTLGLWHGLYGKVLTVFTSVNARFSSVGWDAVQPGPGVLATVAAQVQPVPEVAPRLSVDYRWLDADRVAGTRDPHSGGSLLQLSPGLSVRPGGDVVITASLGVPVFQDTRLEREGLSPRVGVSVDL